MFIDNTLDQYIDKLGSGEHIPGGGSAAGLVAALGSSLINMVYNLTKDKKSYLELDDRIQKNLEESINRFKLSLKDLKKIVDEDTIAFDGVMEAFKLPKDTIDERLYRKDKIQEGYKIALETPYKLSRLILDLMKDLEIFARYGNIAAITDIGIGVLFLYSSLESSNLNIRINLKNIEDVDFKIEIETFLEESLKEGQYLRDNAMKIVYERLK